MHQSSFQSKRRTELKGNPVQIRNYPRSCKFYPPIVWGSVVTFLATGYGENRDKRDEPEDLLDEIDLVTTG